MRKQAVGDTVVAEEQIDTRHISKPDAERTCRVPP